MNKLCFVLLCCSVVLCAGKDDLDQSCGINQEVQCVHSCPPERTCRNRFVLPSCLTPVVPCQNKCICKEGFYKNSTGLPHLSCGVNEEVQCVHSCPPEGTCRNRFVASLCAASDEPCEHKCVCKEGYFKNSIGTCITNEQCEQCSKENEFYACDSACDNECENISIQNRTNCPIKNIVCNRRCYCDDGFARDRKGDCVPVEKCDPVKQCSGINEVYTDCKRLCPPELCFSLVAKFSCVSDPPCEAGCVCKPGFLRKDAHSPCKPICECDEMKHSSDCL